ncbi:MAG: DNA-primase RepB domain-containing protein [Bryobacteraceae bacterium]|nr:DNA-primase RepB domain-containing protein [Bryobacteraceae bacterium]
MDPEVPARYLRENFEPTDRLAIVLIQKETHRVIQRVATAQKIAEPEFQAWLRHENARKFEVYVSMNSVKEDCQTRTKESIAAIRHIYLDFDENATAAVQALLKREDIPEPNYLLNTSLGKWQATWKVEGFTPEEAERLQRHLVSETGADQAATDSSRVLRLPGFMNHKYGKPFLVRADSRATVTYRPEHFPSPPSDEKGGRGVTNRPKALGALSQSERDWSYAKRALARGESPDDVAASIAQYRSGDKTDPQDYAARTVRKARESLDADQRADEAPSLGIAR